MIDLDWLRRLIDLVDGSDIDSLEISRFGTRVKVAKTPPMASMGGAPGRAPAAPDAASRTDVHGGGNSSEPTAAGGGGDSTAVEAASEATGAKLHKVTSPMVGTFYRAPAPDAPPYVEVGDRVRQGQTLCILEAMKLMNELESEVAGTVREVAVQNADPVEFGQILFRIELDGGS